MQPEIKESNLCPEAEIASLLLKKQMSGGSAKTPLGLGSQSRLHSGELRLA